MNEIETLHQIAKELRSIDTGLCVCAIGIWTILGIKIGMSILPKLPKRPEPKTDYLAKAEEEERQRERSG